MIATHPRSTSTALERAFLTRKDVVCIHEPFGEAFYYGPERLSDRYTDEECSHSEHSSTNFQSVVKDIIGKAQTASQPLYHSADSTNEHYESSSSSESDSDAESARPATIVIKDMAQYFIPPKEHGLAGKSQIVAKSLQEFSLPFEESPQPTNMPNPTLLPEEFLTSMRYAFLIRPPHMSIPSYYKCCIPPQSAETGFDHYRSSEAGYRELRILYDYVKRLSEKNPKVPAPIIIDSLDLIANPEPLVERICEQGGFDFDEQMLSWGENSEYEVQMFAKWKGFHNDALSSTGFKRSTTPSQRATPGGTSAADDFVVDYAAWEKKWRARFDNDDAIVADIRQSVEEHMDDYLYLRKFRLTV